MKKKYRLLDYEMSVYQPLNYNGWAYYLLVETSSWWGLIKTVRKHLVEIPHGMDVDKFYSPKINKWLTKAQFKTP